LGFGVWGLGIGYWGLRPLPNPQSPIPNPHFIHIIQNACDLVNLIKN